ncbi:response regulator [Dyadobacter sp. CY326]|uniref:response regulator n=1 Tax=Dyadobacter sp. CY326 TaxID=2907300 RepID=UPI001F23376D|nr:response regulator [Dyadobacter sp. CY326]MCE7065932.1 response regulator [Dyadobacter sp. CY326]
MDRNQVMNNISSDITSLVHLERTRILVVDDHADTLRYIELMLTRDYEVVTAINGIMALEKLRETLPALVVSDVTMPEMDGLQLLKEIKKDPYSAHIPVILLTANAGEEAKIEGFEAGADDYIVKPFSEKELRARVKAQIKLVKTRSHIEKQLSNLFEQAPVAIGVLKGPLHVVELMNPMALSILGRTQEEILHKPFAQVLPQMKEQGVEEILNYVFNTGKRRVTEEMKLVNYKGGNPKITYLKLIYEAQQNSEGIVTGVMIAAFDITDQVNSKRISDESDANLKLILENMPHMSYIADPHGYLTYYNRQFYNYTGLNPEIALGLGWTTMVHPDMLDVVKQRWHESITTGCDYDSNFLIKRASDGAYRWHLSRATALKGENGQIMQWVGTLTDIHSQKMFAQELERNVKERTRELRQTVAQLDQFAYVASHDLQEPLRKIRTFSSMLRENIDPEKSLVYFEKIESSASRMTELINDVLSYSRLSSSEALFKPVDLNLIFEKVMMDFELAINEKNAVVHCDPLPIIEAIPLQMNQLFANLIGNSLKFCSASPVIEIKSQIVYTTNAKALQSSTPKPMLKLVFQDNGIGFKAENKEKIFQLFQRLHGQAEYKGTGIGLSLCKKIAEGHKGNISAESQYGSGATFTVHLPLKHE